MEEQIAVKLERFREDERRWRTEAQAKKVDLMALSRFFLVDFYERRPQLSVNFSPFFLQALNLALCSRNLPWCR